LDKYGKGSYSQVIDGIQWAIAHKDEYNIRVMNLSLSAPVQSRYWEDPLNQAVMKAWQSGIVVVVAAGNSGPDPMSIGVPGNNPYVITVGALTDAYTPVDWSDDYVPTFSAAGPTYEGFVKPDLVAPGGHVVGLMSDKCELAKEHPNQKVDKDYYTLTGTSMSAAQVSGVVALMLARKPDLTPDEVKYRLLASAIPAITSEGKPAFSIWQQGAGRVDALRAVYGEFNGSANQGLDINADLAGTQHFAGLTMWDQNTDQFYLVDPNGQPVGDGYAWGGGVAWSEAYTWGGGVAWSEAYTWGGGVAWSEAFTWGGGVAWSEAYTLGGGVAWSENISWGEATASLVSWVMEE
jgi:serine protease AprX